MIISDTTTKVKRIDVVNGSRNGNCNVDNNTIMCSSNSKSSTNGTPGMVATPTTPATDMYAMNGSTRFFKTPDGETNGVANGNHSSNDNSNGNGSCVHRSPSNACDSSPTAESPRRPRGRTNATTLFRVLRFLVLNGPLLACWALLLVSWLAKELWNGPLEKLLQSFALGEEEGNQFTDTYSVRDPELTYYHRRCDHRDISTHDANDLLVDPGMTSKERQDIVMTHGAAVMKDIIGHDTARELRAYLETRHHEFHSNNLELPWDELFWDGDGGSRLSLGLGPEDASIVARSIAEVGSNVELKKTLESILGKDPAVVEVSTLSTMHDAKPQGIHTDSDYFGSSVLYTRSFLHSYTMFISLQDTTSRMGATTICPGTHWCADIDLADLCQCNYLDHDEDESDPIGYCNTFEASSNGQTGLDVGVLQRGDAMMFNQNVWHRGPRNFDSVRKENRAMFIMTFLSRRDYEKGDNRQQGWGTYYYMRHSMWGHLFSDLKTAASGGMDLFQQRIWKAYGIVGASKTGNLPWLEHWARMMANNMDFFSDSEVEDFQVMLRQLTTRNRLANWLFLDDDVLKNLFGDGAYDRDDEDDDDDEDDEIGWKDYLRLLVESALHQSKRLYSMVAIVTVLANAVGYTLYCVVWWILRWAQRGKNNSSSSFESPQPIRDASRSLGAIVAGHLLVLGIAAAMRHYVLFRAPLFERIHTGDVNFEPFPSLPVQTITEVEYNDDGEQMEGEVYYENVLPIDLLDGKQDREQRDFRTEHPKHPYSYYFEKEYKRLAVENTKTSDFLPRTDLPDLSQLLLPIQETAFPERNDVLIGSRFDADFLASMNFVLDFHPGTKDWIQLMKEHQIAVSEIASADEAYLDMAVDTIVSKILDRNDGSSLSLLSNEGGTPRRFLKQDYETGWWITMTQTEAITATRRALLALARPKSVGVSYEHWKQVLADSRFGKRRHTALAKKWIPQIVDTRTQELFAKERIPTEEFTTTIVSPMASGKTTKGVVIGGRGRSLLPSTGRGILPKSMVTGKTAFSLSSSVSLLPPTVLPLRVHLRKLMKGVATLKIGDHVVYADSDSFFQATIVSIDAEEHELEIQPLRSDEIKDGDFDVTTVVHAEWIQFHRPIREKDTVWVLTRDPDDEDERSWKKYEVLFLSPFGQVDLLMTPEYAENYSNDDFGNRPIEVDIKTFHLSSDVVPKIRLRQYN